MDNLEYLIPKEISCLIEDSSIDLEFVLIGFPCQKRYPRIRIHFNDHVIFDDEIKEHQKLKFSENVKNLTDLEIRLEYYNKQDNDTTVDDSGDILENQFIKIEKIFVNNYDLIDFGIIYNLGTYRLNLTDTKKQYFIENNINVSDSHSLDMVENGSWNLKLQLPINSYFCSLKSTHLKHELWPNQKLLNEIHNLIKNIRTLENDKFTR